MSDVYRKIRNTFRYLLGNLSDFDPKTDSVAYADMEELDRWALLRMEQVKETVLKAYDDYEFHDHVTMLSIISLHGRISLRSISIS